MKKAYRLRSKQTFSLTRIPEEPGAGPATHSLNSLQSLEELDRVVADLSSKIEELTAKNQQIREATQLEANKVLEKESALSAEQSSGGEDAEEENWRADSPGPGLRLRPVRASRRVSIHTLGRPGQARRLSSLKEKPTQAQLRSGVFRSQEDVGAADSQPNLAETLKSRHVCFTQLLVSSHKKSGNDSPSRPSSMLFSLKLIRQSREPPAELAAEDGAELYGRFCEMRAHIEREANCVGALTRALERTTRRIALFEGFLRRDWRALQESLGALAAVRRLLDEPPAGPPRPPPPEPPAAGRPHFVE